MSTISLNPEKMTPATVAIFDLMCDGDWYDNQTLIAFGAAMCATEERADALKNGRRVRRKSLASGKVLSEEALVESGAKDLVRNRLMIAVRGHRLERNATQHRMTAAAREAWVQVRPTTSKQTNLNLVKVAPAADAATQSRLTDARPALKVVTSNPTSTLSASGGPAVVPAVVVAEETVSEPTGRRKRDSTPLVFGGFPEADGWLAAPLSLRSRVHFRIENGEVPLREFRIALPAGCEVAFDEGTGLYRVDCQHGTGDQTRDFIRDWCENNGLVAKALRAEPDVRRRNVADLHPDFLSDLCLHYAQYSKGRINKHQSTLQFHFQDKEDRDQQVFEWILDAVGRYDDASGVPFGAFLSERISKWVHNLNRDKYGRTLSDTELKHQRALQEFTTEHGRKPTERELASAMGVEITTFRKNAQIVSTLQGLRNVGTLDVTPGETEIHLPDEDMCDDRYNNELQQSLLHQILTTSCEIDETARGKLSTKPNVLGLVAWYENLWGTKNKTELSTALGTSMRNMNEYTARVQARMETKQHELLGG